MSRIEQRIEQRMKKTLRPSEPGLPFGGTRPKYYCHLSLPGNKIFGSPRECQKFANYCMTYSVHSQRKHTEVADRFPSHTTGEDDSGRSSHSFRDRDDFWSYSSGKEGESVWLTSSVLAPTTPIQWFNHGSFNYFIAAEHDKYNNAAISLLRCKRGNDSASSL